MIPRNPITLALFTTTKGHFGRTTIYRDTVDSLLSLAPAETWGHMVAHIKESDSAVATDMEGWLSARGFEVLRTRGEWAHFAESHQRGYLDDARRTVDQITTPYTLWHEDDWAWWLKDRRLDYWLHEATSMLESDPTLVQVRIARFTNEGDRINRLKAKHGLPWRAGECSDTAFYHGDWSCNPFIARTRDLRAALHLFGAIPGLPIHIEHGLGAVMRAISGMELPFACLNPARIRVGHLGTRTPEEADDLSKPLLAD